MALALHWKWSKPTIVILNCNGSISIFYSFDLQILVRKVRNKVAGTIGEAFLSYDRYGNDLWLKFLIDERVLFRYPILCPENGKSLNQVQYF